MEFVWFFAFRICVRDGVLSDWLVSVLIIMFAVLMILDAIWRFTGFPIREANASKTNWRPLHNWWPVFMQTWMGTV